MPFSRWYSDFSFSYDFFFNYFSIIFLRASNIFAYSIIIFFIIFDKTHEPLFLNMFEITLVHNHTYRFTVYVIIWLKNKCML